MSSEKISITMKCQDCGHVQVVRGVLVNGAAYFGSAYDFCDLCDGLPVRVETPSLDDLSKGT